MDEYVDNRDYARFLVEEFIPLIESSYPAAASADSRVILGGSASGLGAAYFALLYPDVFPNVAMFSPALGMSQDLDIVFAGRETFPLRVFVGHGHQAWDNILDQQSLDDMAMKGITYEVVRSTEAHSWAQWRGMMDEMLTYFFGV
jgi:enterochelin esterase-like enzyme